MILNLFNELFLDLNNLNLKGYFKFIFLSFFIKFIFDYLYINCFKKNKKWLIVDSPSFMNNLKINTLDNTLLEKFTFEYTDKINDENHINSKNYYGIILNKEKIENSLRSFNLVSNLIKN